MTTFSYENSEGKLVDWPEHAFSSDDLDQLDKFLIYQDVLPLMDVVNGLGGPDTVAMRHDVDHSIDYAFKFAQWEYKHNYSSTYFILHTAWYYRDLDYTMMIAGRIQALGHEIGFHNDSIGAIKAHYGGEYGAEQSAQLITNIVTNWRNAGFPMVGCADHGGGHPAEQKDFWNQYQPSDFGFEYEAYQLMSGQNYISDNGGKWRAPLEVQEGKQTHMLVHPCHWELP